MFSAFASTLLPYVVIGAATIDAPLRNVLAEGALRVTEQIYGLAVTLPDPNICDHITSNLTTNKIKLLDNSLKISESSHIPLLINQYANGYLTYYSDDDQFGIADHWDNLHNVINKRSGDCEEFALLKYALALKLGISHDNIYYILSREKNGGAHHAQLYIRWNGAVHVLDNLHSDTQINFYTLHYEPIFFCHKGQGYLAAAPYVPSDYASD